MATASVSATFTMYGARAAIAAGLSHIELQVAGIERAVVDNPGLAFDLAKTVVESACKTILTERSIPFGSDDGLSVLFKAVTSSLPLLPPAASAEAAARKSLAQTLSGLHSAMQGIAELRNAYGFASHGSDAPRPVMETVQALLIAQAADAIVGFLHRVHCQDRSKPPSTQIDYDKNPDFNAFVDETNELVHIFDLEYRPSEVLFNVDHEAYRVLLTEHKSTNATAAAEAESQAGGSA